jgi:hypothetical protein
MEIHGCDVCVKSEKIPLNTSLVEILVEDHWPEMVTELDTSDTAQLWLFLYKDQTAKNLWDENIEHGDGTDMISAIWTYSKPNEVWFVIDDNKANKYIIDDIEQFIRNCEHGNT